MNTRAPFSHLMVRALVVCGLLAATPSLAGPATNPASAVSETTAQALVAAARRQVGVTVLYTPTYARIGFPGGDVPRDRGVCTDVVIRAYRDAFGYDLQKTVNEDMRANFSAYPKNWGLKGADSNIDHRRVPNLRVFFTRKGKSLPVSANAADYKAGDLVTVTLPGNLPHIMLVSDRLAADRKTPLVIHNVGAGAREQEFLFSYPITGHYRLAAR